MFLRLLTAPALLASAVVDGSSDHVSLLQHAVHKHETDVTGKCKDAKKANRDAKQAKKDAKQALKDARVAFQEAKAAASEAKEAVPDACPGKTKPVDTSAALEASTPAEMKNAGYTWTGCATPSGTLRTGIWCPSNLEMLMDIPLSGGPAECTATFANAYGNSAKPWVRFMINGQQLAEAGANTKKTVTFTYKDGDKVQIREGFAIIKLEEAWLKCVSSSPTKEKKPKAELGEGLKGKGINGGTNCGYRIPQYGGDIPYSTSCTRMILCEDTPDCVTRGITSPQTCMDAAVKDGSCEGDWFEWRTSNSHCFCNPKGRTWVPYNGWAPSVTYSMRPGATHG